MKAIQLQPYQMKAMNAIQGALENGQKHIVVEMATGSGKGLVLAKTVELLHKHKAARILVVTNRIELKKNVEHNLFDKYQEFVLIDKDRIKEILYCFWFLVKYPAFKKMKYLGDIE